MLKKIVLWLLVILALILIAGTLYFFLFIYKRPLISEKALSTTRLMPLPSKMKVKSGEFAADQISFKFNDSCDSRVRNSAKEIAPSLQQDEGKLIGINVSQASPEYLKEGCDESYKLKITPNKVLLEAATVTGALRGLETLKQLVQTREGSITIPSCKIEDTPRYPWRGLMVDVCRHWIPKDVMLRIIDGMAVVKLNVLHWHLSEYQAFRIESKTFPKLHEMGSGGKYYTQDEVKEVIEFARMRGIRVVPEFDLPGHSTSWFVGYPELASAPGPYQCDTVFGVLNPVMDPTREEVYDFLDRFFEEMSRLFPDEYIHIGGDEVNLHDWEANPDIQKFMEENNLEDGHALQAYFNKRLQAILKKHGKKMAGWDEILHPNLDTTIVVQAWRSQKSLWDAVRKGGKALLSSGWYLDHKLPAGTHYKVDPEILPNAITIEPDTIKWKTYKLELHLNDSPIPMEMTLYGDTENLRGFLTMMDNMMAFNHAQMERENLTFKVYSDYGELTCKAVLMGDTLYGTFGLGIMKMGLTGKLSGSNEIAGTRPPKVEKTIPLSEKQKKLILGGEACIWTEVATAQNIESRIWPRTAAIAEKLWSPASLTKDTKNMYRRLKVMDKMLVKRGAKYYHNQQEVIAGIVGGTDQEAVQTLVDVLEEVKYYNRLGSFDLLTVNTPLVGLADAAFPESLKAYDFDQLISAFVSEPGNDSIYTAISGQLKVWEQNHNKIMALIDSGNSTEGLEALSRKLKTAAETGLTLAMAKREGKSIPTEQKAAFSKLLNEASRPDAGAEVAIVKSIIKLL